MEAKDYVILIVGILTFAVGSFNAWLTFASRTSTHRDELYKKRMEVYDNIFSLFAEYHISTSLVLLNESIKGIEVTSNINKHDDIRNKLIVEIEKNRYVIPDEISKSLYAYLNFIIRKTLEFSAVGSESKNGMSVATETKRLFHNSITEARSSLGIESLSKDIVSLTTKRDEQLSTVLLRILEETSRVIVC